MKRLLLSLAILASVVLGGAVVLAPAPVFASDAADQVCSGIGAVSGSGCASGNELRNVLRTVINLFSVVVGILAVIMIIVAGFKYVTAAGESSNITSAKQTLIYAIVGLVIASLAQAIVRFVLRNVS